MVNFNEERKLRRKGYKIVVGIDESGRGPLSGPVIAAAVFIKSGRGLNRFGIRDSKKLSSKQREDIFKVLKEADGVEWGIGRVSEKVIDKINILEATKLAMARAVKSLKLAGREADSPKGGTCNLKPYLIIDGNFGINLDIPQKSIIKADEKVMSCALAGIIAKVSRDRMMLNYHKKYPQYGFDRHKGYPTRLHREMLKKYGFCKIHRKTFKY